MTSKMLHPFREISAKPDGFVLLGWTLTVSACLAWAESVGAGPESPAFTWWTGNWETIGHLCLLIPTGMVLAFVGWVNRGGVSSWIYSAGFALVFEGGQFFVSGRTVSLDDFLANMLGCWAGVRIGCHLMKSSPAVRLLKKTGVVAALALLGFWMLKVLELESLSAQGWNPKYEIVAGNESGGGRSYSGQVSNVLLCAGEGDSRFCVQPGASILERKRFVDVVSRSQVLEVFADVLSTKDLQTGPARIVTFSNGSAERNVTLGQQEADLVFRVRSRLAGDNGSSVEYHLPFAVPSGVLTHVYASFNNGVVTMRSISARGVNEGTFRMDFAGSGLSLSGWDSGRVSHLFQGLSGRVMMLLMVFSVGYWSASLVPGKKPLRLILGIAIGAGFIPMIDVLVLGMDPPSGMTFARIIAVSLAAGLCSNYAGFLTAGSEVTVSRLDASFAA